MNNSNSNHCVRFWVNLLWLLLALSCATMEHHEPENSTDMPSKKAAIHGPATVHTPKGMRFTLPKGFRAEQDGAFVKILDPDEAIDFYILELDGQDCKAAAGQIWKKSNPEEGWHLQKAMSPPSDQGYDEVYVENYTLPDTQRFAQVIVYRKGRTIWTGMFRATLSVLEKRGAQINHIFGSIKAPFIDEVNLNDRLPVPIAENVTAFETFIEDVIQKTRTPGLSIAVVEGDRIVYAKGFGVREVDRSDPVTSDTLMMIGSVTKSLTTLLMATLVDDKVFAWTDPVTAVHPSFRLGDADLTRELHMEHLACACTGLPRKDLPLALNHQHKSPSAVFNELAVMTPSTQFKETFQYQNHMLAAAGYIAAKTLDPKGEPGAVYDRAMQERLLNPMGMTASTFDFDRAGRSPDRASPHCMDRNDDTVKLPLASEHFVKYVRPAGGLWSTAKDMAAYVITELRDGVSPGGRRVVSAENLRYRRKPQVATGAKAAYGLGWEISTYKGVKVVGHGGGTTGFATLLNFLPEKKLGVVMIANGTGGHSAEYFIWRQLLKHWFNEEVRVEKFLAYHLAEGKKHRAEFKAHLTPPDKKWISRYLGTHANDEIGHLTITAEKSGYYARLNTYRTELMQYQRKGEHPALVMMAPPFYGERIYTNGSEDDSFTIIRAQEKYVFSKMNE